MLARRPRLLALSGTQLVKVLREATGSIRAESVLHRSDDSPLVYMLWVTDPSRADSNARSKRAAMQNAGGGLALGEDQNVGDIDVIRPGGGPDDLLGDLERVGSARRLGSRSSSSARRWPPGVALRGSGQQQLTRTSQKLLTILVDLVCRRLVAPEANDAELSLDHSCETARRVSSSLFEQSESANQGRSE